MKLPMPIWRIIYLLFLVIACTGGVLFVWPFELIIALALLGLVIPVWIPLLCLGGAVLLIDVPEIKGMLEKYEGFKQAQKELDSAFEPPEE